MTAAGDPPAGMAVGSFTSASLEPPLVAFLPDRTSTTWPRLREAGRFCVNILAADQEDVCRRFATKAPDKFGDLAHRPAPWSGSPIIDGVVAWIDCSLESVTEAGDHFLVLGRVEEMAIEDSTHPLLFFQGGYGRFTHLSLTVPNSYGRLTAQLRVTDFARPPLDALASELGCHTAVAAPIDGDILVLAVAGDDESAATLVGSRVPFVPPLGAAWAAFAPEAVAGAWLSHLPAGDRRESWRGRLEAVRERGFSVGLVSPAQHRFAAALDRIAAGEPAPIDLARGIAALDYDPPELSDSTWSEVRVVIAPVFGPDDEVVLLMSAYAFGHPRRHGGVAKVVEKVRGRAAEASAAIRAAFSQAA